MKAARRLLIVEDDPSLRAMYLKTMEGHYDLTLASDGQDGWEAFQENKGFPVILTDIKMPKMDGMELANQILSHSPNTQFLFVSGYLDDGNALDIMNKNAYYLPKPVEPAFIRFAILKSFQNYEQKLKYEKLKVGVSEMQKILNAISLK